MANSDNENTSRGSGNKPVPALDKTFVEGGGSQQGSPLTGEPYANPGAQEMPDQNMLPTGNDKIPLGSGTVYGLLGTGGMARVYKIWNDKLEVFRAVKILLPTQKKDLRNRFETEAKITAKLHHPNIVEIYNVGDWNGLPYLEMEYVDGDSIEAIIAKRGKLPTIVCCAAAIFVVRALEYAHSQEFLIYGTNYHGIIHRDMKPANIMISKSGSVKLMDFGIARPTETSLHTVDGNIVGTMQYLSPEQIDGIEIDCRTDLYSFGAILYEMLTGIKTFPQNTITNLIKKKIVNEYRKFSDFDFAISTVLVKITQKCLQADKSNRYNSAKDLLNELEAALKTMSLEDPSEVLRDYFCDPANYIPPAERKTIKIHTPGVKKMMLPLVGALIFLAVIGGFVITIMTRKPAPTPVTKAPAPLQQPAKATSAMGQIEESELKPLSGVSPAPAGRAEQVRRITASAAPKPTAGSAPATPMPAVRAMVSIEKLTKKYGTTDLLAIGKSALGTGNRTDAILALEALPDGDDTKTKYLLLLEAYIDAGRTKDALFIATSQSVQDAYFDILCGRLYQSLGKSQAALDCFENALTKPSAIRSHSEIRNDALYLTALERSELYRKDPGTDNREQAVNSWTMVKKMYANNSDHARYKSAEKELLLLK